MRLRSEFAVVGATGACRPFREDDQSNQGFDRSFAGGADYAKAMMEFADRLGLAHGQGTEIESQRPYAGVVPIDRRRWACGHHCHSKSGKAVRWRAAVSIGSVGLGCLTIMWNGFTKQLAAGAGSWKSVPQNSHDVEVARANQVFLLKCVLPLSWRGDLRANPCGRPPRSHVRRFAARRDGLSTCSPCTWRSRMSCSCARRTM